MPGRIETGQIPDLGEERNGVDEAHTPHGLQRPDHRKEIPALDLFPEHLLQLLDPLGALGDGIDVILEDDLLGRSRHDHLGEPTQRGFVPVGLALVTDAMAKQKGLEALAGGLLVEHGILTSAREITNGVMVDIGHVDRCQVTGPVELGQAHGIATVGFDPITGLFWDQRRGDDLVGVVFAGEMAVEAKAARTGLIDEFQGTRFTLELGDEFVDGIDTILYLPVMADLAIEAIGGDGHINGFLVNIHSDEECARF